MKNYSMELNQKTLCITVTGEFVATVAQKLQKELEELKDKDICKVIFDLKEVTFIASSGLRVFIFAKKRINDSMDVDILNASAGTLKIIKMSGLISFFNIVE